MNKDTLTSETANKRFKKGLERSFDQKSFQKET